jgi:hypothetical protein
MATIMYGFDAAERTACAAEDAGAGKTEDKGYT